MARRRGERESVSWPHILLLHAFNRSEDDKALVILSTALLGRLAVHITLQSRANDASGCRLIVAAAAAEEKNLVDAILRSSMDLSWLEVTLDPGHDSVFPPAAADLVMFTLKRQARTEQWLL